MQQKIVAERLEHSSITLTLDTYSHVLPTMQQGAVEVLEKRLFRKSDEDQVDVAVAVRASS